MTTRDRRRVEEWMTQMWRLIQSSALDHKGWEQSREEYLRQYAREYYRRRKEAKAACSGS